MAALLAPLKIANKYKQTSRVSSNARYPDSENMINQLKPACLKARIKTYPVHIINHIVLPKCTKLNVFLTFISCFQLL